MTRAPVHHNSKAAIAAEFFAPTTSDVVVIVRVRLLIVVQHFSRFSPGTLSRLGTS